MLANNSEYIELLEQVKREIAQTRNKVAAQAVNEVICMYWRIGMHLNEAREYGANYIDSLSQDIRREYPEVKWANARNLRYMAKFAREADEEILHTVYAKLSWSHNKVLMDRAKDLEARQWYAHSALEAGWSNDEREVEQQMVDNVTKLLELPMSSRYSEEEAVQKLAGERTRWTRSRSSPCSTGSGRISTSA